MPLYPRGCIAQVERKQTQREFVEAVSPDHVLLKIQYARQLLKVGKTADDWFPEDVDVITSTAIRDGTNAALPLEANGYKMGEVEIVEEFGPDFHIPADRSDYVDFDDEKRYERVRDCMHGTITMQNHVEDKGLETTILPFVKGVQPKERYLCYRTLEQLGMDHAVIYANGYFNDGRGVRIDDLIADIELIADESAELVEHTDELEFSVLNCLSPNVLERLPENVVAASGLWVGQSRGWREKVTPTKQTDEEMQAIYSDVEQRVRSALGLPDRTDESASVSPAGAISEQEHVTE